MKHVSHTTQSFDIQHYLSNWSGTPAIGEPVEQLWMDENNQVRPFFGTPNTKYAVAIGTPVWPIYVRNVLGRTFVLDATLGEITKETKHEWTIDRGMFDYGKYVCVIFAEDTMDEDTGIMTKGFFVLKDALYVPGEREGKRAKNGKRIAKRVEVQSSSNANKKYEVLYYEDASISCNCHAWIFSKLSPKSCKHTKKVMLDILNGFSTP